MVCTRPVRLWFLRFVVSKVLNQTDCGGAAAVTAVYDRNDYLTEKRRALGAWAIRLLEIVEGKNRADNVVKLAGSRDPKSSRCG